MSPLIIRGPIKPEMITNSTTNAKSLFKSGAVLAFSQRLTLALGKVATTDYSQYGYSANNCGGTGDDAKFWHRYVTDHYIDVGVLLVVDITLVGTALPFFAGGNSN